MRRLNLAFLAMVVAVTAVLGGSMYLVHGIQIARNASTLLEHARRAEAGKDLEKAQQSLTHYLNIRPRDGLVWKWYARVVEVRDTEHRQRDRALLIYEQALRHNPGDRELERRCADLSLELKLYGNAERHLAKLYKDGPAGAQAMAGADSTAEVLELLGECDRGLTRFEEAEKWFRQSLEHDPRRLSCYNRLARLLRTDLRRQQDADRVIAEMVAKNPTAALARVYRWRYFDEFAKTAAARDIDEALKLAPDDPEVLLTAAVASERKPDVAAARAYYERGFQRDPHNLALSLGLARIETTERHFDRAEAVLRQAFQADPCTTTAIVLAENLILQDKIEGPDGAAPYLARLRDAGLGNTVVRFLEAEALFHRQDWARAIPQIEMARALLGAEPELMLQCDLMLAECHHRVGDEERRLDALRRAAEGVGGSDAARVELAQVLERSGKRAEALIILVPLAARKPEWRLELVRLLLEQAIRQPRDQRNWQEVEGHLRAAEQALPRGVESLALLRVDVLAAQGRLDEALARLTSLQTQGPRNPRYRLALARLTQRRGQGDVALQIIDEAERELGPSLEIQLARVDYWALVGGAEAKSELARLAESRRGIAAPLLPTFLDRLGSAAVRLGETSLARQYWGELAVLEPNNVAVRFGLFELALAAGDEAAPDLVAEIKKAEGEDGAQWRFARAALLIDRVRRGDSSPLDEVRDLASKISERRPRWWGGFALKAEIAELAGSTDQAIAHYIRAIELGSMQPSLVRRALGLLIERKRYGDIDRVAGLLRDQGGPLDEVTIVNALDAIRNRDFDRGIALARQVFPETSARASDHVAVGRLCMAAGRSDEAGREFRRAVELGPGVPESWLAYVQYLVESRQIDQARAAATAARRALAGDRKALTLAQCCALVGDVKQAEELINKAMNDEGKSADPAALRLAATLSLNQDRLDLVTKYLAELERVTRGSPGDLAWANRVKIALLLRSGRGADRDRALALVDQNLKMDHDSALDLAQKASILALRVDRRGEAVTILERLLAASRAGDNERFLLAQLYLARGDDEKYRGEIQKLVTADVKDTRHLAHFIDYWIGRARLDEAERWLLELKKAEPRGLLALDAQARLLAARQRRPELRAMLVARGREVPGQIGVVANLLDRHGFADEALAAYKASIAGEPGQPERVLPLAQFLARHDRPSEALDLLARAWSTCPPDQVALAALALYDAPSADANERSQVKAWLIEAIKKGRDLDRLEAKLATVLYLEGRFDEAEALYRKVLDRDPDNAESSSALAWELAMRDPAKCDEALTLINRAIAVHGPVPSLINTRAVAQIRANRSDRALEDLRVARTKDPTNPNYALHLAWALLASGKTEAARGEFREAERLGLNEKRRDPLLRAIFERLRLTLASDSTS